MNLWVMATTSNIADKLERTASFICRFLSTHPLNIEKSVTLTYQEHQVKVKVVPYTFVRRGVPTREETYPEPSAYEVGWPVPFLAVFISPVLPAGTHLLLGGQRASIQSGHRVGLKP